MKPSARSVTSSNHTSICVCVMCDKAFGSKRAHAKTCSDACRKAYSRRKDTIRRAANKMHKSIRMMRDMHQQWPDLQTFIDRQIRGAIEM